jgi:hypothetical protein
MGKGQAGGVRGEPLVDPYAVAIDDLRNRNIFDLTTKYGKNWFEQCVSIPK